MSYLRLLLLSLLVAFAFNSCKKEENDAAPAIYTGKTYFPDQDSIERVYLVDSIAWDEFTNTVDTFTYYFKEVIQSHYSDNQGRSTQRIERYLYDSTAGNWVIWKVLAANLTSTTAELVDDNFRYVRLTFPVKLNASWNGNSQNTLEPLAYKITEIHAPESTPYLQFDSTLTVIQQDDFTFIYDRYAEERYAAGKGLYYRIRKDVETNPSNLQITSGYLYRAQLISFTHP